MSVVQTLVTERRLLKLYNEYSSLSFFFSSPECYASVFGMSLCTFGLCDLVFYFVFCDIFLFM